MLLVTCVAGFARAEGGAAKPAPSGVVAEASPPVFEGGEPPAYPEEAAGERHVDLVLVVGLRGEVVSAEVLGPIGDEFERRAVVAAKAFRFRPALVGGKPVVSKIRFPLHFHAPKARAEREPLGEGPPPPSRPHAQAGSDDDAHLEVTVHGERPLRTERRGASDIHIHREVLEAAPRSEGADVLLTVPGLVVARSEGLAVAHGYSLRGFDAEHGQDIEFSVGGLPINLPSHIHGQGYTDLGFLLADVVDELRVHQGVSDPKQGDFAVAGSIQLDLGVDARARGLSLRSSYGSFDTFRQQAIWAPKESSRETFGAAQMTVTDGFGENRSGLAGSAIFQHRFGEGRLTYRAIGFVNTARAGLAGYLRRDDVDRGEVCFYCSYDFPTTNAQSASNQRVMAGLFADYRGYRHSSGSFGLWVGHDRFRIQQNFTGFLESSRTLAGVAGRGDLLEQMNSTNSVGLFGRYRTEAFEPTPDIHGTVEVGADGRLDGIEQRQNLLDASVRSQTWDRRIDATIHGLHLGLFGDLDFQFGQRVSVRAGGRAQLLSYDVDDRLGNFAPLTRPQDNYLVGYRRSAMGATVGPRTSIDVKVSERLGLAASFGQGFRSPQARILDDGERAPFSVVTSGDLGFRLRYGEPLELNGTAFATHLSEDLVFEAAEGSLSRVGASLRVGGAAYLLARPTDWLLTSLSFTYVRATLLEPPPATPEEPNPPFRAGETLPYVSPVVARLDFRIERPLVSDFYGAELGYRLGTGLTYRHARPLPYGQEGAAVGLLDASAGLVWRGATLTLEAFNLLDRRYPTSELFYVSDFEPSAPSSRVPARHVSAGAPLSFLVTLGITL